MWVIGYMLSLFCYLNPLLSCVFLSLLWTLGNNQVFRLFCLSAVPRDIGEAVGLDCPQTTLPICWISPLFSRLPCSQVFFIEGLLTWLVDFSHRNFRELKRISSYKPLLKNPSPSQLVYDYKWNLLSVDRISSKPTQTSWVPLKALRTHTLCFLFSENNLAPSK